MSQDPKPAAPTLADSLTPEQKSRLDRIQSVISFDKITVSFSIEDRDPQNRKKSCFYSVTASRGTGAELATMGEDKTPAGFSHEDVPVVRALLSKHVVKATYDDAIRRRVIGQTAGTEECMAILGSYDKLLYNILNPKPPAGEKQ